MKTLVALVLIFLIGFMSLASGGGSSRQYFMLRAGKTPEQIERALSLPETAQISDDFLLILPSKFIRYYNDGRKSVIYTLKDTVFGEVFHELPNPKSGYKK